MSPGLLQPTGTQPAPSSTVGRSDALESVKSGVAGHAAQLAGLARDGSGAALQGMPAFETTYAVPMHCAGCVAGIEGAVAALAGVEAARADLGTGLVHVRGTAAPSAVVGALQASGRDAILRGSGASNSAAVCILELDGDVAAGQSAVRGLARLVQVSATHTLVDLTLSGLQPGTYEARIRASGDISHGLKSLGGVWQGTEGISLQEGVQKGDLGIVKVDEQGRGAAYIAKEMSVWEIIGRGMSIMKEGAETHAGEGVCGVLARSAGVWDNDKVVCSCSGKTVWEERQDQRAKGIL